MTRIAHCLLGLVVIFLSTLPNVTSAAIVALTFDTLRINHVTTTNSVEHGFRISPSCHMHIAPGDQQDYPDFDGNVLSMTNRAASRAGGSIRII
jgi:hypothetical protein